jgi:hypothetical protein
VHNKKRPPQSEGRVDEQGAPEDQAVSLYQGLSMDFNRIPHLLRFADSIAPAVLWEGEKVVDSPAITGSAVEDGAMQFWHSDLRG